MGTMQGGLITSIVTQDVLVSLLGPDGAPLMSWAFIGAWPVKWNVSALDSMENSIAMETLELSYNYFVEIPGTPAVSP